MCSTSVTGENKFHSWDSVLNCPALGNTMCCYDICVQLSSSWRGKSLPSFEKNQQYKPHNMLKIFITVSVFWGYTTSFRNQPEVRCVLQSPSSMCAALPDIPLLSSWVPDLLSSPQSCCGLAAVRMALSCPGLDCTVLNYTIYCTVQNCKHCTVQYCTALQCPCILKHNTVH